MGEIIMSQNQDLYIHNLSIYSQETQKNTPKLSALWENGLFFKNSENCTNYLKKRFGKRLVFYLKKYRPASIHISYHHCTYIRISYMK